MSSCGDIWVDGDLIFGAIAAAGAIMAYILYTTVTMGMGPLMGLRRRKKRTFDDFYWGKCIF